MYDAIVIGAGCAGAPTAMLLARKGYRVLVVDRATFPRDTLSSHTLWPMASSYLERWGLLGDVLATTPASSRFNVTIEGIALEGRPPDAAARWRMLRLHRDDHCVVHRFCCPRQRLLDEVLVKAARRAGAEVREGFDVDEVVVDDGRVVGIKGRTRAGRRAVETARVVIGADGRHSVVAQAQRVPTIRERSSGTFAFFSHVSGLSIEAPIPTLQVRGRFKIACAPTNDDLHRVAVFGPAAWFDDFRRDVEGNFLRSLEWVAPALAEPLRAGARREEPIRGTADGTNYCRQAAGPGWALVGDAASMTDPSTALGVTHAFRGAELLASALDDGLSGRQTLAEALGAYARLQAELAEDYLDYAASQAEMNPPSLPELHLARAMRGNHFHIHRFIGTLGDVVPAREFFVRENLDTIAALAKEGPELHPIFREYEARQRAYGQSPFAPESDVMRSDAGRRAYATAS